MSSSDGRLARPGPPVRTTRRGAWRAWQSQGFISAWYYVSLHAAGNRLETHAGSRDSARQAIPSSCFRCITKCPNRMKGLPNHGGRP